MGIRTTAKLDKEALERVQYESRSRGISFQNTLNDLLRVALHMEQKPRRCTLKIEPTHMGYWAGLNYDSVESLLEHGEGEGHR
jgi:hypothetical protein